jgi:hypothetical protein
MDMEDILRVLKYNKGVFPRHALNEAINLRDRIIPHLLEILAWARENMDDLLDEEKYMAHIYAMYLLAQFREKRAYPLLIEFFSVSGEDILNFTGDVVTGDLGRILASVYDGDSGPLFFIIENQKINEYVRTAALECLVVLFVAGMKTREEIVDYFRDLFRGKLEREFSHVWNALVARSTRIYPEELYEDIKKAYEDDLVEGFFVDIGSVERVLKDGKEKALEDLMTDDRYSLINDTVEEMQNWACFRKSAPSRKVATPLPEGTKGTTGKKKQKVGRNAPCPCGSGKKYKKCCIDTN